MVIVYIIIMIMKKCSRPKRHWAQSAGTVCRACLPLLLAISPSHKSSCVFTFQLNGISVARAIHIVGDRVIVLAFVLSANVRDKTKPIHCQATQISQFAVASIFVRWYYIFFLSAIVKLANQVETIRLYLTYSFVHLLRVCVCELRPIAIARNNYGGTNTRTKNYHSYYMLLRWPTNMTHVKEKTIFLIKMAISRNTGPMRIVHKRDEHVEYHKYSCVLAEAIVQTLLLLNLRV